MELFHFSEDPGITVFEPRAPLARPEVEPLVWAIDGWHAPMYYVPRECPRACFWRGPETTSADRERWFGATEAKMVIAVESAWLKTLRTTTLYRYLMPETTFTMVDDDSAGHWVSRDAVTPLRVEPMRDLLAALAEAGVELRIMPSLVELWRGIVQSTLSFSGTRLRNGAGFTPGVMDELNALYEGAKALRAAGV